MTYNNKTITKVLNRNLWAIRYRKNGKQKTVYGKTQKQCVDKYKKILKQKTISKPAETQKEQQLKTYTLKEWYEKFKQLYKINKVRDTTIQKDDYNFNTLKPLHNIYLQDLSIMQVLEQFNKFKEGSPKLHTYILLNSMLEKAKDNDLIDKNIMCKIEKPKYKAPERIALTKEQEKIFIEKCNNSVHKYFFLMCLFQGLRSGECKALKVNDIDLQNNTLRIDESKNSHSKRMETKNAQSNRIMPLFDNTKNFITELINGKNENDFIFTFGARQIDCDLKNIIQDFNFKKFTCHNLRHTFITRCQELNIPLYIIQSWVGHEKGSVITTKIYTHLTKETNEKYTKIINQN